MRRSWRGADTVTLNARSGLEIDAETRLILGAAILGSGGDETIHGLLDAVNARLPYEVLQRAVPIHPTVSELIPTLLGDLAPPG